jgi:hypothetical protein
VLKDLPAHEQISGQRNLLGGQVLLVDRHAAGINKLLMIGGRHITWVKSDAPVASALHHQREEVSLACANFKDLLPPESVPGN